MGQTVGAIIKLSTMSKQYKSEPLAVVHGAALDLTKAGVISKKIMRVR